MSAIKVIKSIKPRVEMNFSEIEIIPFTPYEINFRTNTEKSEARFESFREGCRPSVWIKNLSTDTNQRNEKTSKSFGENINRPYYIIFSVGVMVSSLTEVWYTLSRYILPGKSESVFFNDSFVSIFAFVFFLFNDLGFSKKQLNYWIFRFLFLSFSVVIFCIGGLAFPKIRGLLLSICGVFNDFTKISFLVAVEDSLPLGFKMFGLVLSSLLLAIPNRLRNTISLFIDLEDSNIYIYVFCVSSILLLILFGKSKILEVSAYFKEESVSIKADLSKANSACKKLMCLLTHPVVPLICFSRMIFSFELPIKTDYEGRVGVPLLIVQISFIIFRIIFAIHLLKKEKLISKYHIHLRKIACHRVYIISKILFYSSPLFIFVIIVTYKDWGVTTLSFFGVFYGLYFPVFSTCCELLVLVAVPKELRLIAFMFCINFSNSFADFLFQTCKSFIVESSKSPDSFEELFSNKKAVYISIFIYFEFIVLLFMIRMRAKEWFEDEMETYGKRFNKESEKWLFIKVPDKERITYTKNDNSSRRSNTGSSAEISLYLPAI